ncbi:hypothetical protein ACTFIY_011817 [Dictyostelium cf. discoideum]
MISKFLTFLIILILILNVYSNTINKNNINLNLKKKIKPKLSSNLLLNVHIVPHTHDDVGWVKTVDEYYYGSNMTITFKAVQYVLDNVIECLLLNNDRKFIYVEIAYFEMWWNEQTDSMKQKVKSLVERST